MIIPDGFWREMGSDFGFALKVGAPVVLVALMAMLFAELIHGWPTVRVVTGCEGAGCAGNPIVAKEYFGGRLILLSEGEE